MRSRWLILAFLGACANIEDGAREKFSADFSCPTDRVTVKVRSDLNSMEFRFGVQPKPEPPAEIKSDPARLALWEEQQKKDKAATDRVNEVDKVVEASGCEKKAFYICYVSKKNKASCTETSPHDEPTSRPQLSPQ